MNEIKYIRIISIWILLIPLAVLNLCLFISVNYHLLDNTIFAVDQIGRSSFTIPYIDGGVSISRTARTFPTYLIFKPGMILTAILLIKYWSITNKLILKLKNETKKNNKFLTFGILSAILLIIHSIFLGIHFDNDFYKLFRKFVILGFIIFEIVAQALLVISLYKIKNILIEIVNKRILTIKIILVTILASVAIISLPIVASSGNVNFKHALEWNYFLGVTIFYLLTFLFWKKKKTQVHAP